MFLVEQRDELLREVQTQSQNNLGYFIGIRKDPITQQDFLNRRFGKYRYICTCTEYNIPYSIKGLCTIQYVYNVYYFACHDIMSIFYY